MYQIRELSRSADQKWILNRMLASRTSCSYMWKAASSAVLQASWILNVIDIWLPHFYIVSSSSPQALDILSGIASIWPSLSCLLFNLFPAYWLRVAPAQGPLMQRGLSSRTQSGRGEPVVTVHGGQCSPCQPGAEPREPPAAAVATLQAVLHWRRSSLDVLPSWRWFSKWSNSVNTVCFYPQIEQSSFKS